MSCFALLSCIAPLALAPPQEEPQAERPGFLSFAEGDPERTRGLQTRQRSVDDGWIFIAPLNGTQTHLIDRAGEIHHTWQHDTSPASGSYLMNDGTLLRCGRVDDDPRFRGGGIGGLLQRVSPTGEVLWSWRLADQDRHHHHDIEPLPNGNILLIAWERISQVEALRHGRDKHQVGKAGLWSDMVLEVQPVPPDQAKIVWEWRAWDHVVQDANPDRKRFAYPADHPGRFDINVEHRDQPPLDASQRAALTAREEGMAALGYVGGEEEPTDEELSALDSSGDWMHTNSIDYDAATDLILLSSPELNEIYILDHSTTSAQAQGTSGGRWGQGGEVLWRWGNPRNYGAGVNADRRLWYQHNPTFLNGPDGELRVLVFNNGSGRPGKSFSSVEELILPFHPEKGFFRAPKQPYGPKDLAWSYQDPDGFYSAFISGCQRLANGNTLICSGAAGRVFEVTPQGELIWDFYSPFGGEITPPDHAGKAPPLALFRAEYLAPNHPGLRYLELGK